MEEGVSITTEKINKNNGVVMEGLVLKSENARVASIFYMEDYFSYWERGVPLEQLVRKVMCNLNIANLRWMWKRIFFKITGNIISRSLLAGYKPHHLQHVDRLTHRISADAQLFRDFPLGR